MNGDQTAHHRAMGLKSAVCQNMFDSHAFGLKRWRYEEGSMALQRLFLGTHQRDAIAGRFANKVLQTLLESVSRTETVVANAPVFKARGIIRSAAQLRSEIHVL